MNRSEHALTTFSEECCETVQRVTKAMRFSLGEIQPGQSFTNAERVMHEWADTVGMMEKLIEEGLVVWPADFSERVIQKKIRFEEFLKRSAEHGALTVAVVSDAEKK